MDRVPLRAVLMNDERARVLVAVMFTATLPYAAFACAIGLLLGLKFGKTSLLRVRARAVEYLKKFQLEELRRAADSDFGAVAVLRIGHDGTPLGVTVSKGSVAAGRHRHNGEVFITTAKVVLRSAGSGSMRVVRIPVDLVLLLKKTAGHVFPRLQRVLDVVGKIINGRTESRRRPYLIYNCQDSGGAGRRLRKILRVWSNLAAQRRGTCCASLTQFCGHHFNQLGLLDEMKRQVGKGDVWKQWCHDVYVFSRKLVYHKIDLIEELEEWVGKRFTPVGEADGLESFGLTRTRGLRAEDDVSALIHILGQHVVARGKGEGAPDWGAGVRYSAKSGGRVIAHCKSDALQVYKSLISKLQTGSESRWLSIVRICGLLKLLDILGGRELVAQKQDGFRKAVAASWGQVIGGKLSVVGLIGRPSDVVMVESLRREGLEEGESLRARLRGLLRLAWAEVFEVLGRLGSLSTVVSPDDVAGGVVRVAMRVEERLAAIDADGVLFPFLDIVDQEGQLAAIEFFRGMQGLDDDWMAIQQLPDATLIDLAAALGAAFTFGTRQEESQHAIAGKKVGLHSHRRTIEGLSQEVLIPQFTKALLPAVPKMLHRAARKKKCPQRASGRSNFLKEFIQREMAKMLTGSPHLQGPEFAETRQHKAREDFEKGAQVWAKMNEEGRKAYEPNAKRQKIEGAEAAAAAQELEEQSRNPAGVSMVPGLGEIYVPVPSFGGHPQRAAASSSSAQPAAVNVNAREALGPSLESAAVEDEFRNTSGADLGLPIPVSKIRELWTESDDVIAQMRTDACAAGSSWNRTQLQHEYMQRKWPPRPKPAKIEQRLLYAEAQNGGSLGGLLFGVAGPRGDIASAKERFLGSGEALPPIGRRLFAVCPCEGFTKKVTFLPLKLHSDNEFARATFSGSLLAVGQCRPVPVADALREYFHNRDEEQGWYAPMGFDVASQSFVLRWSEATPLRDLPLPGDDESEEDETDEESDEEEEDGEIRELMFANELRERELRDQLDNPGATLKCSAGGSSGPAAARAGAAGSAGGRSGAQTANFRAREAAGQNAGLRHRGEPGYRQDAESVAAALTAARLRLDEIPAAEEIADGYSVRLNGGLWLRAHTRKGAPGHRSWHPEEGLVFSSVVVSGPAAEHREAGLQVSKTFDIHKFGGQAVCWHLARVWASGWCAVRPHSSGGPESGGGVHDGHGSAGGHIGRRQRGGRVP